MNEKNDNKNIHASTKEIVLLAIIFAIMITFLMLLPQIAHVPLIALAVLALRSDVRIAALGGLLFGLASLLSALLVPSTPLYVVFLNPLVSVVPRIFVGIGIYFVNRIVFKWLVRAKKIEGVNHPREMYLLDLDQRDKVKKLDYTSMVIASVTGALINTVLVMGTIFLFYTGRTFALEDAEILVRPEVLLPIISIGAVTEPIVTAIVAPPIVMALKHIN